MYGEGDSEHLTHVSGCDECQAVLAVHEEVVGAVVPVADQLDGSRSVSPVMPELPEPANRNWPWVRWVGVGGLAVAAAAVVLMLLNSFQGVPVIPTPDSEVALSTPDEVRWDFEGLEDDLDLTLDALDDELDSLEEELFMM